MDKVAYGIVGQLGALTTVIYVLTIRDIIRDNVVRPLRKRTEKWERGSRMDDTISSILACDSWPRLCLPKGLGSSHYVPRSDVTDVRVSG